MRTSPVSALAVSITMLTSAAAHCAGLSSGFIENPPALSADGERAGASVWIKPGLDLSRFSRVAVDQIEIFLDPASSYKGVSADSLKAVSDQMQRAMDEQLEPEYPVVGKTGPGVMYLRLALTNVNVKKKKRGLLSFTPMGIAVTAIQDAAGARTSLRNAVVQAEVLDGASGERIAVFVDELSASIGEREYSWNAVTAAAQYYGKRIRDRLDAAHRK